MKKWITIPVCFTLALCALSGCGSGVETRRAEEAKPKIIATIFPQYDWVRQILGEHINDFELTLLLDNGVDLHSYHPTAEDMVKVSTCDMFIYTGGESDEWVDDALGEAVNPQMVVIDLLDVLGDKVKEEELVEGMQGEDEAAEDVDEGEAEYDEHVWLSLRNAATLCGYISDRLGELDPLNKDIYTANAAAYMEKLTALDAAYQSTVNAAPVKTLLFGDRFPFRYLAGDYGLDYYAAFSGCSAETEASFETVIFLANKVDELGLSTVLTIENSDGKIARTIVDSTQAKNAQILQMNSLQSTTLRDVSDGVTYLGAMEQNLIILRQALR